MSKIEMIVALEYIIKALKDRADKALYNMNEASMIPNNLKEEARTKAAYLKAMDALMAVEKAYSSIELNIGTPSIIEKDQAEV